MADIIVGMTTVECATCGIPFCVSRDFEARRRADHKGFFCPYGHSNIFRGKSDTEVLQEKLKQEQNLRFAKENEAIRNHNLLLVERRRLRAAKGRITKLKSAGKVQP